MAELDVSNVRELEDFLINECMYAVSTLKQFSSVLYLFTCLADVFTISQGIVRGKLDQLKRCFEVCFVSHSPV